MCIIQTIESNESKTMGKKKQRYYGGDDSHPLTEDQYRRNKRNIKRMKKILDKKKNYGEDRYDSL